MEDYAVDIERLGDRPVFLGRCSTLDGAKKMAEKHFRKKYGIGLHWRKEKPDVIGSSMRIDYWYRIHPC